VIVVSDTSPLNYLILIDAIDVLPKLFPEVFTTNLVLRELTHPKAPEPVRRWAQAPPQWLNVVDPVGLLPSTAKLDPGEASAISLAKERHISNIIIDESKGTKIASQEQLFPIPTLAIVEIAIEKNFLTAGAIEQLQRTNIRCPRKLFDAALERAKSRNKR
jgi:predicted nucleic acid-binding protein